MFYELCDKIVFCALVGKITFCALIMSGKIMFCACVAKCIFINYSLRITSIVIVILFSKISYSFYAGCTFSPEETETR